MRSGHLEYSQTLERLAERGGLSPIEVTMNMSRKLLTDLDSFQEFSELLIDLLRVKP
jgi:hypothetical protein